MKNLTLFLSFLSFLVSLSQQIRGNPAVVKKYIDYDKTQMIPPKPEGIKRIIVIGDSVTAGHGITEPATWDRTWPGQMFRFMPDRTKVEVVQCAMSVRTMSRKSGTSFLD